MPQFRAAFARLAVEGAAPPASVGDLPLIEVAASGNAEGELLAVVISGDGGWAGLDREVASVLAARGIPVVGLDSLRYFWTRRTPDEAGAALERVLDHYLTSWGMQRALLVGYSRGADVLPFMASRLPARTLERVALIALIGPGREAEFEFHVADWLVTQKRARALPILPEIEKLRGQRLVCLYGSEETGSLCPTLPPGLATLDERPGAHHFGGDYRAIAERIMAEAQPPGARRP
jgi:type IV secretory pathway VirJ component